MYAILGATGNTGKVVAGKLLSRGEKVRAIGRDARRLDGLVQQGAEAFVANAADAAALTKAFNGVKAAYLMIPPHLGHANVRQEQELISDALAAAVQKAGVEHAVVLSSIGADKPDKTGPVLGLHSLEQKLSAISSLNAVYLRAGYFMENLLPQVGIIRDFGVAGGPLNGDLKVAMIATEDIGAVAAETLLKLGFSGKQARELLGQRDVTYREVAAVIGKGIGKPDLAYVQFPAAQLRPALMQMGMSASMVDLLLEMCDSLNSGYMAPLESRSAQNTTPTSIETFVSREIIPRFKEKSAGA